ncbi:MAG: hypothetical protein RLZZ21_1382 [Planctomycetota bacterium]|jgi:hypothetical protein
MAEEVLSGELVSVEASVNAALAQITKAEIDQQIATAHAYPRSIAKFKARALEMATLDEETAESCIYSRPVGKDPKTGQQKYAEGMSVRMAEIVGACFGNLRVGAMIVEMTPRYVKARGFAHDLETNFASTSEVVESTVKSNGMPYDERMRAVVAKAAISKARRDATFQVVPKALCKPIEAAARQAAIGDASTIGKRRDAVAKWVAVLGIDPARVWASLGVAGAEDLTVDHLTTLTGVRTAIKDGESTIDEAFPAISDGASGPAAKAAAARAAALAKKKPAASPVAVQELSPADPKAEAMQSLTSAIKAASTVEELEAIRSKADAHHDDGLFGDRDVDAVKSAIFGRLESMTTPDGEIVEGGAR